MCVGGFGWVQDNGVTGFKLKKSMKFEKMFTAFCTRKGVDRQSTRFLFDGERLQGDQTPADLDMEDNEIVEAFVQMLGGR